MSEWIGGWSSPRLSADAEALARDIADRLKRQSIAEADRDLKTIQRLLIYVAEAGVVVRANTAPSELFSDENIIGYEQSLQHRRRAGDITASTMRTNTSRLIALVRDLDIESPTAAKRGHTHREARATTPMPDSAFTDWLQVARTQPSGIIGLRFTTTLLLCRGVGLSSSDLRVTRGTSVRRRRDGVVVVVIERGPAPRSAVALGRHAEQLLFLGVELGDQLVVGDPGRRRDPVGSLLDDVVGGVGLPRPLPRALRDAYILEMLHTPGLEIHRLWEQLGGKTLSAVEALIGLVPAGTFGDLALLSGCDAS